MSYDTLPTVVITRGGGTKTRFDQADYSFSGNFLIIWQKKLRTVFQLNEILTIELEYNEE